MASYKATTLSSLSSPQAAVLHRGNDLSSHTLGISHFTPSKNGKNRKLSNTTKLFALSHIYTHMTFGLFTNIASRALGKHIHKYVPASGSLSGYIRHPAPRPGSSSSGSDTGYSSFGSSFPIPGHPTIPSGGTVIPTQTRCADMAAQLGSHIPCDPIHRMVFRLFSQSQ